jgi:hypothetical protein
MPELQKGDIVERIGVTSFKILPQRMFQAILIGSWEMEILYLSCY